MIYVICNEKGGAGKSSLAQSLAVWIQQKGLLSLLLVDADPQRTTADWAEERQNTDLEPISCVQLSGNIVSQLNDLGQHYQAVVVDCGGADSKAMRSALAVADIALLPFRAKRRDLKVAVGMAEVIEQAQAMNSRLAVYSVITQAPTLPSQAYRVVNAKTLLADLGLSPLDHITRNVNAWDDAEESGSSVLEYEGGKSNAGDDARAVFEEMTARYCGDE